MLGRWISLPVAFWRAEARSKRWWLGVLCFLGFILVLDRISNFFPDTRAIAVLAYIVGLLVLGSWMGLRAALGAAALLVGYTWLIYAFPSLSHLGQKPDRMHVAVWNSAIFFSIFALIGGAVNQVLARARVRVEAAWADLAQEAEHRRAAEAELWASEEMSRLILSSALDAVVGIAPDRTVMLWSPNAEKLFGWTRAEAMGQPAESVLMAPFPAREGDSELVPNLDAHPDALLGKRIETTAKNKSGTPIDIELCVVGHGSEAGTIYLVFAHDIRERKKSERTIRDLNATLRDLNARLEERVAERTRQLEEANAELLGFAYSVSHDLRAPLRAIVSNSRIVSMDCRDLLPADSGERLQRVEASALKMAELIDNLLQYARVGKVSLASAEVDVSALATRIGEDLKLAREGSLAVEPGVKVLGDPELIELVLVNLLENAWKYVGPDQHPDVSVGRTEDGAIFVRDQGIGFDMQYVGKIWEPFERLHSEKDYPGTGIGLANAKKIIERHGGEIWTESKPGQGTTMYFRLEPAQDADPRSPERQPRASAR